MTQEDILESLEELIASPGWALFRQHAVSEWTGIGYRSRIRTALASGDLGSIKAIDVASTEIDRIMAWPTEALRQLKAKAEGRSSGASDSR